MGPFNFQFSDREEVSSGVMHDRPFPECYIVVEGSPIARVTIIAVILRCVFVRVDDLLVKDCLVTFLKSVTLPFLKNILNSRLIKLNRDCGMGRKRVTRRP